MKSNPPGKHPRLIIDGYNLLRSLPQFARLGPEQLPGARDHLLILIARYTRRKRVRVTVVFDGAQDVYSERQPVPGGIDVRFARPPRNADREIVEMVRRAAQPRAVTVVTADQPLARSVRALGAAVVSSRHFLERLEGLAQPDDSAEKPEMSPGDLEYWKRIFGRE
jgi:predicted RNA-binding protein with PIN domain